MAEKSKTQVAMDDYFKREPDVMNAGENIADLLQLVADEHGITYKALRNEILDATSTLGAG